MPRPHPKEFRDDVVAVARRGDAPIKRTAHDFGISESCLRAPIGGHRRPQPAWAAASESAEVRGLRRRNRLLEHENEVLRRAAAYLAALAA